VGRWKVSIYAVWGERGEYSSHSEWPVCFYTDRESADKHAAALTEAAKSFLAEDYEERTEVPGVNEFEVEREFAKAIEGVKRDEYAEVGERYFVIEIEPGVLPVRILSFTEWKASKSVVA
jgi:hypothetical protein